MATTFATTFATTTTTTTRTINNRIHRRSSRRRRARRESRIAHRVPPIRLRVSPGRAPSRSCFIRACRGARARTLRAFCRTMTTYLCTKPLATSARAVLSSSVAADDFAPSKVTASIAAARGTTGATRALAPRLPAIGRGDVIAAVPWSAALERMVKPCIASHESESRSGDARNGKAKRRHRDDGSRLRQECPLETPRGGWRSRSRARRVWLDFGG